MEQKQRIKSIAIDKLVRDPCNLRPEEDITPEMVSKMAVSIQNFGVVEPLVVRRRGSSRKWFVVEGMIRLAGAAKAGLTHVPCRIVSLSDDEAASLSWAGRKKNPFSKPAKYKAVHYFYNNVCGKDLEATSRYMNIGRHFVAEVIHTMEVMEKGLKPQVFGGKYSKKTILLLRRMIRDKVGGSYVSSTVPVEARPTFLRELADALETVDGSKRKTMLAKKWMAEPWTPIIEHAKDLPDPNDEPQVLKISVEKPLYNKLWKASVEDKVTPERWVLSLIKTRLT